MSGAPDPTRVAITAGAGGIGREIARAFAGKDTRVAVCDADAAAVTAAADDGLDAQVVDVADGEALDRWLDGVLERFGGLDVLVNNAGIAGPTALVEDIDPADWERCIAIDLSSHFRASRRVIPAMKAAGAGSIINLSSTSGLVGCGMRAPYVAAKWAVIGLTKTLAIELGPHGVRANAICPGSVDGERMRGVIHREASARGLDRSVVEREYIGGQSISRFVQPGEIADMCVFLASDAARMVTGQAIAVDGHTETFHLS
ncbi:MAG TPA: SDR family oxidoreductase [Gaiellales bacterium]|nr:SDR family oxidoreductase [Gaiellales bacterium]